MKKIHFKLSMLLVFISILFLIGSVNVEAKTDITNNKKIYTTEGQNLNFAIPINEVKPFLKSMQLKTLKEVKDEVYKLDDIAKLKLYSKISDHYNTLFSLTDSLKSTNDGLSLVFDSMYVKNADTKTELNKAIKNFDCWIGHYNELLDINVKLAIEAKKYGLDISSTSEILNNCSDIIDYYKEAFKNMSDLYSYNLDEDFNKFMDNRDKAFHLCLDTLTLCDEGYNKYFYKLQSY